MLPGSDEVHSSMILFEYPVNMKPYSRGTAKSHTDHVPASKIARILPTLGYLTQVMYPCSSPHT